MICRLFLASQEEDETQEDDSWELVKDAARVEKSEQGDETVYSVIVPTETFLEFCQEQYDGMVEWLASMATVTTYGDEEAFFACLKNAMEEELTLDFYTRHGFVTNVALEATIDTAEFEEYRKELREEGAPMARRHHSGSAYRGSIPRLAVSQEDISRTKHRCGIRHHRRCRWFDGHLSWQYRSHHRKAFVCIYRSGKSECRI